MKDAMLNTQRVDFYPFTQQLNRSKKIEITVPEMLFITTYTPRECGIATYSEDLIHSIEAKYKDSFKINICPIVNTKEEVKDYNNFEIKLNLFRSDGFEKLLEQINENTKIQTIMIQHEFGLFYENESHLRSFLQKVKKPIIVVFHTVLPNPNLHLLNQVKEISGITKSIIVMTKSSADILAHDYQIERSKINIIQHGTHLVPHVEKEALKIKYNLDGKLVLSTFGFISSGKNIETTLYAMPMIIEDFPNVKFLIIGKTHPSVLLNEGNAYREKLENIVEDLKIGPFVTFVNAFLPLPHLLEYLQLTDIYLFTSKDPNQAVSGTFSYALSCGCPIISTPIPHSKEILSEDTGIIIDFENSEQLAEGVINLLTDNTLRTKMGSNSLHKIAATAWENSAIAHAQLFAKTSEAPVNLYFQIPEINLAHFNKLTTGFGMLQFSILNAPDPSFGYTLDDNARALIALCKHYQVTRNEEDLKNIKTYLYFIAYCQQSGGDFLNYVDFEKNFTQQNYQVNLADANGRAIWAIGYVISLKSILPKELIEKAEYIYLKFKPQIAKIHSTRAMAFMIKGIYNHQKNNTHNNIQELIIITELADRLVQMYKHESREDWQWFESYLTYANSVLPEALLCAYLATKNIVYKEIAVTTFDFLISKIFTENRIKVISNQDWLYCNHAHVTKSSEGGEQPIDVAYTILALHRFNEEFKQYKYYNKIKIAFNWFLGNNHLNQIVYNPCTGGCYDGIEEKNVNLNQGAESTVSYLLARMAIV